VVIIALGLIYL